MPQQLSGGVAGKKQQGEAGVGLGKTCGNDMSHGRPTHKKWLMVIPSIIRIQKSWLL